MMFYRRSETAERAALREVHLRGQDLTASGERGGEGDTVEGTILLCT